MQHPLRREDGPVVYNYCWPSPAHSFSGRNPSGLMTTVYCFKFESPPPGGQIRVFITPRNRVAKLYPQALSSLSVAFYKLKGYGGGDSNPSPHPGGSVCYPLTHKFEADRIQNTIPSSASTFRIRIRWGAGMNWSSRISCYDRRSVGQPASEQSTHLWSTTRLPPLIRDLLLRRQPRLAGPWFRHSTPPPHRISNIACDIVTCVSLFVFDHNEHSRLLKKLLYVYSTVVNRFTRCIYLFPSYHCPWC
jgi:hypothetical protein